MQMVTFNFKFQFFIVDIYEISAVLYVNLISCNFALVAGGFFVDSLGFSTKKSCPQQTKFSIFLCNLYTFIFISFCYSLSLSPLKSMLKLNHQCNEMLLRGGALGGDYIIRALFS
jgi:hypothetical protein